jgi:radical SAM superfamily enzyme YgiQ (UPF0313 family)
MKILFVDILRSGLDDIWPAAEHSIGLMYLSAALKRRFGERIDVKICSLISLPNHLDEDHENMLNKLNEFKPDIVGIRSLTISKDCVTVIARTIKEWDKDCFLISGGPYATDDPYDVLNEGLVDAAVIGEGENTIIDLVQGHMEKNTHLNKISGIAYRQDGKFIKTSPREFILDLDDIPFPDYTEVDLDQFSNRFLNFTAKVSSPHANIMTSRGCPYRCAYCHNVLGKRFRKRSPENVFEEIRYIHDQFDITDFQIIDDIFNLDMDRAKKICDLIIASNMKLTFAFPNAIRADRVDEELVDKMAEAGTKFTSIAIETAVPRLQKLIQKNLDLEKAFTAIDLFARAGVVTRGFFMMGFPTETETEVIQTIEYAKSSSLCGATFFTVVYYPGTQLYRLAQSYGYFKSNEFEVQRDYVQVSDGPYEFSLKRLIELKKKAIFEFAFTRERIKNALEIMPPYFSDREIDGLFMAYVVSSQATLNDIQDEEVRRLLNRHFVIAERFSKRSEFYV